MFLLIYFVELDIYNGRYLDSKLGETKLKKAVRLSYSLLVVLTAAGYMSCVSAPKSRLRIIYPEDLIDEDMKKLTDEMAVRKYLDELPEWTPRQVEQVMSWFEAKHSGKRVPFPPVPLGNKQIVTMEAITGFWYVMWQGNDSLHILHAYTRIGATRFRYIFTFTLSPGVNDQTSHKFSTWSAAFNSNRLTQYKISRVNDADHHSLEQLVLRASPLEKTIQRLPNNGKTGSCNEEKR
jgi:hypothetical protein